MAGPLDGIRVLDLSAVVVGPICTHVLCEHGASHQDRGALGRPAALPRRQGRSPGMNGKFLNFNRGKKSIAIDLKKPAASRR